MLDMNDFEISNFKQQSKFAQMIFEDYLMLVLDVLVVARVFSVPKVTDGRFKLSSLILQIVTTCFSLYSNLSTLKFESESLDEGKMEYMLICLKAK